MRRRGGKERLRMGTSSLAAAILDFILVHVPFIYRSWIFPRTFKALKVSKEKGHRVCKTSENKTSALYLLQKITPLIQ